MLYRKEYCCGREEEGMLSRDVEGKEGDALCMCEMVAV